MLNKAQSIELGNRLSDLRKHKELTQREVADLLEIKQTRVAQMELGDYAYKQVHERIAIKPFAELYDITEDDLLEGIYDINGDKNDLVKDLTNSIEKLKKENRELAQRADMWKARVEEIKADKQTVSLTVDHVEYERQQDRIRALEDKVRTLEANQKTPIEKFVLAILSEKYA